MLLCKSSPSSALHPGIVAQIRTRMARGKLAHRLRRAVSLGMDVPTHLQLFKTKFVKLNQGMM